MSLRDSVLEAALWAKTRADARDPIRCLRSAVLAPKSFDPSRHETVDSVIVQRREALKARGQQVALASVTIAWGRLLAWERDNSMDDGYGEEATGGYLDSSDLPPWDTWIAYAEQSTSAGITPYRASGREEVSCLVSWVPTPFVKAVDRAIGLSTFRKGRQSHGIYWLRDSKLPIAEVLRADGLLT